MRVPNSLLDAIANKLFLWCMWCLKQVLIIAEYWPLVHCLCSTPGFRSAPLCFIQWLINPLCLYLPRPHTQWAFQSRPSGKCSVQRDMFKNFSEKSWIYEALLRLNGQQFDSIQSKTITLHIELLLKETFKWYFFHITKIYCLAFYAHRSIPDLIFISKEFTLAENDGLFKTHLKWRCTQMLQPL